MSEMDEIRAILASVARQQAAFQQGQADFQQGLTALQQEQATFQQQLQETRRIVDANAMAMALLNPGMNFDEDAPLRGASSSKFIL